MSALIVVGWREITRLVVPPCRGEEIFVHCFTPPGLKGRIVTNSGCRTDGQEMSRQSVVQPPPIFVVWPAVRVGSAFASWKASRGCITTNQERYENNKERNLHLEQYHEHVDNSEQPQQVVKDYCGSSLIYVVSLWLKINKLIQTSHSMLRCCASSTSTHWPNGICLLSNNTRCTVQHQEGSARLAVRGRQCLVTVPRFIYLFKSRKKRVIPKAPNYGRLNLEIMLSSESAVPKIGGFPHPPGIFPASRNIPAHQK